MGLIDLLKRWRLVNQGLSSGQKRRKQGDNQVIVSLKRSFWVRAMIFLVVALGLGGLIWVGSAETMFADDPSDGLLVGGVLMVVALAIFHLNHGRLEARNGRVILVFGGILCHLWLLHGICILLGKSGMALDYRFLLLPMALAPMVHSVLLGPRAGVFSTMFVSLYGALMMQPGQVLIFAVVSMMCGLTAVYATRKVRRRSRLLRAGFYVGAMALLMALFFGKVGILWGGESPGWSEVGVRCLLAFGTGVLTGLLVGGILPLLEALFNLTTDVSWLELSDLNHPLLKRMQLEAPGTFHHSMVVATLAETAAEAIGAQALMCRACAYFHDIGKLKKPQYFIENQGESNPHDELTPTMSSLIIVAHVKDGVDMAIKHNLNENIIEMIQEHHGDSMVYFFYRRAQDRLREMEERVAAGKAQETDLPKVDEKSFRYPGPTPRTRESGILSLADAVESASRSLKKPTPGKIKALIDEIVLNRVRDGQLDRCELTMEEIASVKKVFAKTLRSMLHARIDYPKEQGADEKRAEVEVRANVVPAEEVEKERRKRAAGEER